MPRTSVDDVRLELEADGYALNALTDTQVTVVGIDPAEIIVNEELAGSGMSAERLELIERYLAGHFILSSGVDELRQSDSETLSDGSSTTFAGDRSHTDFRSTSLGQKAVAMDSTDTLKNIDKPAASIRVPDARQTKS